MCLKLTKQEFIERAQKIHGNKYNYDEVVYIHSQSQVTITCTEHGNFNVTASMHIKRNDPIGCRKCMKELKDKETKKHKQDKFIARANQIHNNKYSYEKVDFINSITKVIIICELHGEFTQAPNNHTHGSKTGCPQCGTIRSNTANTSNTKKFIEKSNNVHNNKYKYDKVVYVNANTNVIITCLIHGDFEQSASAHKKGQGCNKCFQDKNRSNTDDFIKKAIHVHGDTYTYHNTEYVKSDIKVVITCKIHGDFLQAPHHHINSQSGCPTCQLCPSCKLWRTKGKLCVYCKPKDKNVLYQKTKEIQIVNFLKEKLPDHEFIHNKSIGTDCTEGHLFPDILYDCKSYYLIIEIDEHQHRGADYSCDERRMYDIIAKLGLPCIFIRYNPDNKNSDKNVLLEKTNKYLNLKDKIWDDFGFKVKYMFYQ